MNQVEKSVVLGLCARYGRLLAAPAGLEGNRIMAAIAGNESSLGRDCAPRYEPRYDAGGADCRNEQAALVAQFGRSAACSYGPWQIMPVNALAYTPDELFANPEYCAIGFVGFFNHFVIQYRHAKTLSEIGQVYNAGHFVDNPGPQEREYVAKLQANYDRAAFPAPATAPKN